MKRILLVEDDTSLGETLCLRLSEEPYHVTLVQTVLEARKLFSEESWDLILLDVGLPDESGFSFARAVREQDNTPIIFLTAMNSAEYRLEGFEIGADDYIPKPFHLKELLLRIRKIFEGRDFELKKKAGDCILWDDSFSVTLPDNRTAELSQRDFELLKFLIQQSPKAVTRASIIEKVFRKERPITQRTVDNSIMRIRTALGLFGEGHLRSVRGVGYQWIA